MLGEKSSLERKENLELRESWKKIPVYVHHVFSLNKQ